VSRIYGQKSRSSCTNKRHSPDIFEAQFSVCSYCLQGNEPQTIHYAFQLYSETILELTMHIATKVLPNSIVTFINFPLNPSTCHQFHIAISPLRPKPRHENKCRSEVAQFQEILSRQWRGNCDQLQPPYALPRGGEKVPSPWARPEAKTKRNIHTGNKTPVVPPIMSLH